jgi:hypothetical protein
MSTEPQALLTKNFAGVGYQACEIGDPDNLAYITGRAHEAKVFGMEQFDLERRQYIFPKRTSGSPTLTSYIKFLAA